MSTIPKGLFSYLKMLTLGFPDFNKILPTYSTPITQSRSLCMYD